MKTPNITFDHPAVEPCDFTGTWRLVYDWTLVFRDEYYTIRGGFVTDGASIPRPLWWLCGTPMDTPRLYAALVHDFLYSGGDPEATRADADDLYRDIQIALGVPRWKAYLEWAALRIFGKSHWQTNNNNTRTERRQEMKRIAIIVLAAVAASASTLIVGCGKSVDVEGKGMYANANSGVVGIGSFEVLTVPEGHDAARIKYSEDTAWLSPSTKTHAFKINLSGSNSVEQVSNIVYNICAAFIATAPAIAAAQAERSSAITTTSETTGDAPAAQEGAATNAVSALAAMAASSTNINFTASSSTNLFVTAEAR